MFRIHYYLVKDFIPSQIEVIVGRSLDYSRVDIEEREALHEEIVRLTKEVWDHSGKTSELFSPFYRVHDKQWRDRLRRYSI